MARLSGATTMAEAMQVVARLHEGTLRSVLESQVLDAGLRAAMLGADEAQDEQESGRAALPERFERLYLRFSPQPYPVAPGKQLKSVARDFLARGAVDRATWDQMSKAQQAQSFTVAGLASAKAVEVVRGELADAVLHGDSLATFRARLAAKLQAAGVQPTGGALTGSHAETVYRNAVASAHSAGRAHQMTQPAVVAARPYWQVLTANDGARVRRTHAHVHGWVMRADDPGWQVTYPPFSYNCRCKVVARSEAWVKANSPHIHSGPLPNLPDEGWATRPPPMVAVSQVTAVPSQPPAAPKPPLPPPPVAPPLPPAPPPVAPAPPEPLVAPTPALPSTAPRPGLRPSDVVRADETLGGAYRPGGFATVAPDGTTPEEFRATSIKAITKATTKKQRQAVYDFTGSIYAAVRDAERLGQTGNISNAIEAVAAKAPKHVGTVWRGARLRQEQLEQLMSATQEIGLGYDLGGATTSATWDPHVAVDEFLHGLGDAPEPEMWKVLYRIESKTGLAVEGISAQPWEREVLMPRSSRFRVVGASRLPGMERGMMVHLEEL